MTIQEIEQKLREMDDEFKLGYNELLKALAELKESKKEGKWKPQDHEAIWFRDTSGSFLHTFYKKGNVNHEWKLDNLPIFPSKKECARYWHFMDTVKEKSYEFSKEEWEDDDIVKYYIQYDCYDECWEVDSSIFAKTLGVDYFKTYEDAQYIIDNFKDELMEYWI